MLHIGIDLHKRYSYIVALDDAGDVVEQGRLTNKEVAAHVIQLGSEVQVTFEATYNWQQLYEQLEGQVSAVILAHPKKIKAIASARIKHDKIDARILADLLRTDLLPAAYIPSQDRRDLRDLVRHRAHMTRQRTQLKNRIHAIVARYDVERPAGGLFTKKGYAFLQEIVVRPYHRRILDDSLELLEAINSAAKSMDRLLAEEVKRRPDAQLLTTMPGIGPYSSLVLLAEIGDINRFPSPKQLGSYAGLVPSTRSSGDKTHYGPITKEGSTWLRTVMIEAAQVSVRCSPTLRRFRDRIAAKHGRNAAKVAVARKMLTILYWMLQRQEPYREMTTA